MRGLNFCEVCKVVKIRNNGFPLLVNGVWFKACNPCYTRAFLRTNLKRMMSAPHKRFMKEEGA